VAVRYRPPVIARRKSVGSRAASNRHASSQISNGHQIAIRIVRASALKVWLNASVL